MTHTVVMLADRFEGLLKYYDEKKIKVISREMDKETEYVKFEMVVSSGFDIIEIFSAGARYGIFMDVKTSV
jgi:hypothetical protein